MNPELDERRRSPLARYAGSAAILRFSVGLAVAAAFALAGCQNQETKLAEHMTRGDAYMKDEKPSEAVIEYKNALQLAPNDAKAHYGLAQAHMANKEPQKAYWELQETVRLDGTNIDARLALGQFLLLGREDEFNQALGEGEAVIKAEPTRWEGYVLRGAALERLKRTDEAEPDYKKALELQPDKPELVRTLAGYYVRKGDRASAEPLYVTLVTKDPSAANQLLYAGFLALDRTRDADAEAAYQKALEVAKDENKGDVVQRIASYYFARERYDDAEKTLKDGVAARPEDLDLIYALARFYHSRGDKAKADSMIEQATSAKPNDPKPFLILSAYRGRNGDLAGALESAEKAIEIAPEDATARLRKAELLVDMGVREGAKERLAQGRAIVDAVLAKTPDLPEGHFVRAKLDVSEGKADDAVASLRRALDRRPDWSQAHFLLASALLMQNDRQQARAEVLRAVELDADFVEARRLLTKVHALLGEHDLAIEEARRVLRQRPEDREMRIALAQSLVFLNKPDDARKELDSIPLDQRGPEVNFAIGRIDMLQGKNEFAREKLLIALESQPQHPEILESLLGTEMAMGKVDESLARIEKVAGEKPNDANLQRLLGIALMASGQGQAGEAKVRRAIELDPNNMGAYQALARFLLGSNRLNEGIATYEAAVQKQPNSAPLRFTLATLYEGVGRRSDAIPHYEEAIKIDPNLAIAKNNLAYLMADQGSNLDRALDLAQEAKSQLPESGNVADTLGYVLLKKGIPEAAIGYFQESESSFKAGDPDLGIVRVHLATAYEANKQPEKAREALERALASLDEQRKAAVQQGIANPVDPPWATDAKAMLERLSAAAPAAPDAPAAPAEG
jgi:tetratricopeptide (TPR) repeat protein